MLDRAYAQDWKNLAEAASKTGCSIAIEGSSLALLLEHIPTSEDLEAPESGAPRENHDGSPCWCNGPYTDNESHHVFCRFRREAWDEFCRRLAMDVDDIEPEITRKAEQASHSSETIAELLLAAMEACAVWDLLNTDASHGDVRLRKAMTSLKGAAHAARNGSKRLKARSILRPGHPRPFVPCKEQEAL